MLFCRSSPLLKFSPYDGKQLLRIPMNSILGEHPSNDSHDIITAEL